VAKLQARHEKDYQSLFRRFSLDVGTTTPDLLAKTTLARLADYCQPPPVGFVRGPFLLAGRGSLPGHSADAQQ